LIEDRRHPITGRFEKEIKNMPEISRFLGIVIAMYYKEHLPPHFHAKYGGQTGVFSIMDLRLIEGHLPKRIISLVLEWAFEHRDELIEDWELARAEKPLRDIPPLV
jgi:hypothetical protein